MKSSPKAKTHLEVSENFLMDYPNPNIKSRCRNPVGPVTKDLTQVNCSSCIYQNKLDKGERCGKQI